MTGDECAFAFASVLAQDRAQQKILTSHYDRYYVMQTFPYYCFMRNDDGHDFFCTFSFDDAVEFCKKLRDKEFHCSFDVFKVEKCNVSLKPD